MFFLANSLEHSLFSLPYVANWRNVPLEACIRVYRVLPFIAEVMALIRSIVIPVRLELTTYSLEDCYSIQLSYGTICTLRRTRTFHLQFRKLLLYPDEL